MADRSTFKKCDPSLPFGNSPNAIEVVTDVRVVTAAVDALDCELRKPVVNVEGAHRSLRKPHGIVPEGVGATRSPVIRVTPTSRRQHRPATALVKEGTATGGLTATGRNVAEELAGLVEGVEEGPPHRVLVTPATLRSGVKQIV